MFNPRLDESGSASDTKATGRKASMQKLRRLAAVALSVTAVSVGLVATANPASAHKEHNSNYTYGNHNACSGAAHPTTSRSDDFWWGHLASTKVELVRGSNCLRGTTDTWSDNYWTGFTNNVYIELYDYWGQLRWRSGDVATLKFSVAGTQRTEHSRRDLYTLSIPAEVSRDVTTIKINQLEGCCL
jgi:hypothetical protein